MGVLAKAVACDFLKRYTRMDLPIQETLQETLDRRRFGARMLVTLKTEP